jgi:rubredoxin
MTKEELLTVLMMDFDEMCFAPTAPECIHAEAYAQEWKRALVDVLRACYAQNGCTESEMPKNTRWIPQAERGEWIYDEKTEDSHCSICGGIALADPKCFGIDWISIEQTDYCPHCGARMKGGEE